MTYLPTLRARVEYAAQRYRGTVANAIAWAGVSYPTWRKYSRMGYPTKRWFVYMERAFGFSPDIIINKDPSEWPDPPVDPFTPPPADRFAAQYVRPEYDEAKPKPVPRRLKGRKIDWSKVEPKPGKAPDARVARAAGCHPTHVAKYRKAHGIPSYRDWVLLYGGGE